MAVLGIPLLAMAAEAIAAAIVEAAPAIIGGVAAGTVLVGDTTKDQSKAEAKPEVMPRTRTRNCKCPPDKGRLGPVNHSMPELSARYQEFVTDFREGFEWIYQEKDFDGFQSDQCLLQEAKANYDQFMNERGRIEPWWKGENGIIVQAGQQNFLKNGSPPARLRWYFMTPMFERHCAQLFQTLGYSIETEYKPM